MNIAGILSNAARVFPHRPALSLGLRTTHTYLELRHRSAAIAAGLLDLGLARGARVAVFLGNRVEYFEILFGAWLAGLTVAPINAKLHPKELRHILEDCQASVLFTEGDGGQGWAGRTIDVDSAAYTGLLAAGVSAPEPVRTRPDDIAWLFYTSGTTGRPKGAMLTHRNLQSMVTSFLADFGPIRETSTALYPAPLSHGAGLLSLAHIARGGMNVVPDSGGFQPDELVELINHFPETTFFAAPTMVNRLVASPSFPRLSVQNLHQIIYGGAPMYVEDLRRALDALGPRLTQAYGQGEAPCTITYLPARMHSEVEDGDLAVRLASVGIPRTGVSVRVVDEGGRDVPVGEAGEVVVAGDVVMRGYWGNPEATREALRDGWLWTGDVGAFDGYGFLHLKDRSKDLIISGGSNIYPREVEEVLLRHPAVAEVCVVGRKHPDWGEEVVAFVAPAQGVTGDELDAFCLDHLSRFKRPKIYRFVDSLPKSHYGKILRRELRETLANERDV